MEVIMTSEEKVVTQEGYNPRVSIIIPVYNGENYVSLAIDSALRQTYDNIEVIVINDGSTDNTDKICKSYKNKIKYIKKENGGVSTALNVGIRNMSGDYFSWLSHDDLYYPEKVETEIEYLRKNNLFNTDTIICSNHSFIDEHGFKGPDIKYDSSFLNRDNAYFILKCALSGITLLIPKHAFYKVSFFDEESNCVQDYTLWFELYKNKYNFIHIPYVLTATRIHNASGTHTDTRYITEGTKFWLEVIEYFNEKEKKRLYGSVYGYYYTLYNFFLDSLYPKVIEYCKEKYLSIEKGHVDKLDYCVSVIAIIDNDNYKDTIDSIINQTYKNIEIILINNSIDKIELKKKYEKCKNIKIVNCDSNDISDVLNETIKKAKGEYLSFIKSGAVWDNLKIEKQLLKLVCSNYNISSSSYTSLDNNIIGAKDQSGYTFDTVLRNHLSDISTIMVKKTYLIGNNISFKNEYLDNKMLCFILDILKDNMIIVLQESLVKINEEKKYDLTILIRYMFDNYYSINKDIIDIILLEYLNIDENNVDKKHLNELNRYSYIQSSEFKRVNKIKRLSFRKKIPIYMQDSDTIMNGKLNRCYRKIRNIKGKIKK